MIAVVKNDGVVFQSGILQFLELRPDLDVHLGDLVMVLGPILAHLRMIGVIGGDTHFGRIVDLRVRAFADSAFVTGREVEDSEERLILVGAVSPMPFPSTFIPYPHLPCGGCNLLWSCSCSSSRAHAGTRDTSCNRMASWSCCACARNRLRVDTCLR